jgi:hypothetical protein
MSIKDNIKKLNFAKQPETGESPAIPEFYANTIIVNVSPFEFEVQNLLVDSQRNVKGAVNLRYSPQTAWTLYKALEKQIERYEEMNGEIALPDEIRKGLE